MGAEGVSGDADLVAEAAQVALGQHACFTLSINKCQGGQKGKPGGQFLPGLRSLNYGGTKSVG